MTKQDLQNELKNSMLTKDELRTSTLRLLLSALNYFEIQKGTELWKKASSPASEAKTGVEGHYEANEDDILLVIQTQVKQRKDSIEQFTTAGRQELVDKETKELEILRSYLPQQMAEDEVKTIVEQTITETGASSIQDMGKVMGALSAKLKGKADMGTVSGVVKEKLSKPNENSPTT